MNAHVEPPKKLIRYAGYSADNDLEGRRRTVGPSGLGYRQEEILSYLTGLAPVGQPVEISREVLLSDLGIKCYQWYYVCLRELIRNHLVRRVACSRSGGGTTTGLLVVLKRLEDMPPVRSASKNELGAV